MVNVSGYCYPDNYGSRYLDVLKQRIGGAIAINKRLERPIEVTLCLGIKTSHGQIQKAADVDDYLNVSERLGVDGAAIFTWEYLQPYLDEVKKQGYLRSFEDSLRDRR